MKRFCNGCIVVASVLALGLIVMACGGNEVPVCDAAGVWQISESGTDDCEGASTPYTESFPVTVTQVGTSITVTAADVGIFTGTISGDNMGWSGSYPLQGGTTSLNVDVTVSADCTTLSGTGEWSWTDGDESCSGSGTISGTRQ